MKKFILGQCLAFCLLSTSLVSAQNDAIEPRFKQPVRKQEGKLPKTLDVVPAPKSDPVREAPKVLAAPSVGIGRLVPNLTLKTIQYQSIPLKEILGKNGLVIAFTNTTCPICKKYGPTLAKLEKTIADQGWAILYVNPTANEKADDIKAFVAAHQLQGRYVHDRDGSFARTLDAHSTAEVFLIDKQRTLVYRGAIDDQYGLGYSHDVPKRTYLLDAIAAHQANRSVDPAATTAPGCELDLSAAKPVPTSLTYHSRISRIIQANCAECHRTGGVAPFSLEKYEDVVAHAGMIRRVVEKGTMPPWFAHPNSDGKPSSWANDRSVSAADKADLFAWLKSDRPVGDPADAPLTRSYADGWMIGKPDAIFEFPKPVAVKATGTMPYQNITVETKLTEDKWVKAVEVRPSARQVVHHVLVFALPPGKEDADDPRDSAAEERKGFFAIYVPGQNVLNYPEGFAKRLPKGSRLRFQMHYTPNGTATEDKTRIGLVFADKAPQYEVKVAGIVNAGFRIPPGADNHPVEASIRVPMNATVLGFLPHMHLRGKAFRYEITLPGGKPDTVLDIPHYDFNWQLYYRLAEPRPLPPGAVVKATGWYDNSTKNPANPDATKTVRWGPQTTDEMMLGYLEYFVPAGSGDSMAKGGLGGLSGLGGRLAGRLDAASLFKRIDANNDGSISREEYDGIVRIIPRFKDNPEEAKALFERLDTDKDGKLSLDEFKKLTK